MKQRMKLRGRAIEAGDVIRIYRGEFWIYRRGLQCKDVPTLPILAFLYALGERWGTWFGDEYDNSVTRAMPIGLPEELAFAKMASLIDKGLVDGCPCGCRGDYVLTKRGIKALDNVGLLTMRIDESEVVFECRPMRRPDIHLAASGPDAKGS